MEKLIKTSSLFRTRTSLLQTMVMQVRDGPIQFEKAAEDPIGLN